MDIKIISQALCIYNKKKLIAKRTTGILMLTSPLVILLASGDSTIDSVEPY